MGRPPGRPLRHLFGGSSVAHFTPKIYGRERVWEILDTRGHWWDGPTVLLTLDAKRRLTVPRSLAPSRPGDHFEAEFHPEDDTLIFRRLAPKGDWLAVLKECPVPMDDLPLRRRELPQRRKL